MENLSFRARPEIAELIRLEKELNAVATDFGLSLKSSPQSTFIHLSNSSAQHVQNVTDQVAHTVAAFKTCAVENVDAWDDVEFFQISMRRMGLSFPSDFLNNVTQGDCIEGYDMSRFQIFRNLPFMEKSSYSLVDMLSYEWPLLFDRSMVITEQMMSFCDEILWKANRTIAFNIPRHYVRELQSSERQVLDVTFKYLSPLFSGPNKPFGILGTCQVRPINGEDPIGKLSFI